MSQCSCCLSPQEERIESKTVNRAGRERIYKILERNQFTLPHVDVERAKYFTESMMQTEGEHLTLRWAKALKNVAEKITVWITPDQLLAGRVGKLGRYGILYPEIDGDFYREVLADLEHRDKSPFQISKEDIKTVMEDIAPYWEGKTYHEHLNKAIPAEIRGVTYDDERGLKSKFVVSETSSYRSALQWVPDYEKVIKRGFIDIQNEAKERLAQLDLNNSVDLWDKKPFLEAMIIVCDAIMIWAKRHVALARELAAKESDEKRKAELLQIAEICERVPAYPARNFREAMQCQWFVQMFSRIEQKASAIISNGRMDQYLYPFYKKDIEEGTLTPAQAKELLECMWVDMAQFIDLYINPTGVEFQEGYAHWEAVTIGGQTPDVFQMDYAYLSQYANNGVLAELDSYIADGSLTLHEINGELVAMQLRTEGKNMNVENIVAGTQIVLTGSDMTLDQIAQRPDADGMLVITPDNAEADKPIDNFTIGDIKTNSDSGIRFDRLWVNNSDIHISEGQLWFDKLYVEDNAHFSNDEMSAAIYGKPPLRDGSDSVYWINTEENRPESSLDMWLNGTGDWMYLRFTDDHIQESNGILLTLDEYDYVYDQRFTAENHLRWQHGRYLDEDWKQAYGYGLSLHNRYGLIDYQEFTETNAGADEVAVEA